jgi:hypothetical protein
MVITRDAAGQGQTALSLSPDGRAVSDNGLRARQTQARGEQSAHDLVGEFG